MDLVTDTFLSMSPSSTSARATLRQTEASSRSMLRTPDSRV
jgi:hypothetical protein